ncbi:MAG TPA: hypothetical protein VKD90_00500 [Gemmataceae bacterium]|nr:hypothetical protein [Gemmataceae bacterium]
MIEQCESTSVQFLTEVEAGVRAALADLDRHAAAFAERPVSSAPERAWNDALQRLEGNLTGWQSILADVAEQVRESQDDLTGLDTDLKRSLDAFAAARKHLQTVAPIRRAA